MGEKASSGGVLVEKLLRAKSDILGEAAMRQTNGPSYEFFRDVLPPLRYVNAAFKHYPIVLGTLGGLLKPRLISNGSAINARANLGTWREVGFPVMFAVGDGETFGADLARLTGPKYEHGYLPIVQMSYKHDGAEYAEESFAGVEEPFSTHGAVFLEFSLTGGKVGKVSAKVGAEGTVKAEDGCLRNDQGKTLVQFSSDWKWDEASRMLTAHLQAGHNAFLCIFTEPSDRSVGSVGSDRYKRQRELCTKFWSNLINRGMTLDTPEPIVNDAWRSLVIGTLTCLKGDELCYSAGNIYERLFEAECGDGMRGLLLFGYRDDAKKMLPPLMAYQQQGLAFHDAAFKLQLLAHYYWLTRDAEFIRSHKDDWRRSTEVITSGREPGSGLLPPENYCGDISEQVYSLNSNANAWRGLRDLSAVLAEVGENYESARLADEAKGFKSAILDAADKSEFRDTDPPFMPIALFGKEKPYDMITDTMIGSYWNLIIPYVLGSGVFGDDSESTGHILDYLHLHGGICMGLIRFDQHSGLFANEKGIDDLYTLRYVMTLLRRDDPERAIVSLYGKLAQGLTRDTFIGCEGSGLVPQDEDGLPATASATAGRPMYLPPCSSSNSLFLWNLRYLMIQDWDMDDDGKPETLRLMFATPKRWLEDGKTIRIERAPTAFGEVSVVMTSHLKKGEVVAEVNAPERALEKTLLRARVPDGWKVVSAAVGSKTQPVDDRGALDITGMKGKFSVVFTAVKR